jgi:arylsulfatase A
MRRIPLLLASLALAGAATAENCPNILLILTDDLGYGDVGCYNPEAKVATPRMDRLASEGMRFTDAHSPATVCTPTRYSIMTGRMAFRTGRHVVFTGAGGPNLIEEGRLTLPEMLRQRGYRTAKFGKWHIGLTFLDGDGRPIVDNRPDALERIDYSRAIPDAPIRRGFDEFFGTACCPTTDWLYAFIEGDRIPVPPQGRLDRDKYPRNVYTRDFRDGVIAPDFDIEEIDMIFLGKSIEFLERHARTSPEQPFFLFHSTQAVHLPSIPAKAWQGKTESGPHGDFIAQTDDIVGSLLDKLEELDIADQTLVIFTSDNGPEVAAVVNMRKDHDHDGARPWRGVKRDQWEGGHRVPLLVRWPGRIQAGMVSDQTVSLTDLMATCAGIVGFELPDDAAEDSFDLLPVLMDGDGEQPVRPYTLQQTWVANYSIRVGEWKYIDHQGSGGNDYHRWEGLDAYILPDSAPDAPGQLYDLATDPGETSNLYFEHPERVKEMKALLDQSIAAGRSAPPRGG